MQRYRHAPLLSLGLGLLAVAGCSAPSRRENVDATARLVAGQVAAPLLWRLDPQADAAAREQAEALLADGLTLEESIKVAFLASPELQLALEQLEISRAEFVAAVTPPNPVAVIGTREPGGDLAAFYPDRSISFGVLQNVIALLNLPDLRAIARHDLERARYEAAWLATRHAAEVAQAWIEYNAARSIEDLRRRGAAIVRTGTGNLTARAANTGDVPAEDLALQRTLLQRAEAEVIRASLATKTARAKLGEELGISGWREDWDTAPGLPALPASDPDQVSAEQVALEHRYDLVAALKAVDARLRVLATQRRFRWLNQLEAGFFRDKAVGGTSFTGPNAVFELPFVDQRQSQLLNADAQLRTALRRVEAARLAARGEIRLHAAEVAAARQLAEQLEREVLPAQLQALSALGPGDPDETERLGLRAEALATEADHVGYLRDYWRARSALAFAAGDWSRLAGLD